MNNQSIHPTDISEVIRRHNSAWKQGDKDAVSDARERLYDFGIKFLSSQTSSDRRKPPDTSK